MAHTETLAKPNKIEAQQRLIEPETFEPTEQELPLARVLGAKVCASLQELWELYPDRRDGSTTHVGRRVVEIEGVAMRDYGQRQLEETVLRSRVYFSGNKSEFEPSEVVTVHIRTDDGEELITVDADGDADMRYRDNSHPEDWLLMPFQRAENAVDELSYRVTIAAMRHGARTDAEKRAANEHARALLHERFPLFGKRETSLE